MRGLPGVLQYKSTDWDAYRIAYRRIEKYLRPAYRTECQTTLPEAYQMTTERRSDIQWKLPTEMLTAGHRDPTKRRIKRCRNRHMQSGFPRAEPHSYHGEYDHSVWSLRVRSGSMISCPRLMELAHSATLKWAPASHIWEPTALTMPGAKAHIIAQSQDKEPLQMTSRLSALGRHIRQ